MSKTKPRQVCGNTCGRALLRHPGYDKLSWKKKCSADKAERDRVEREKEVQKHNEQSARAGFEFNFFQDANGLLYRRNWIEDEVDHCPGLIEGPRSAAVVGKTKKKPKLKKDVGFVPMPHDAHIEPSEPKVVIDLLPLGLDTVKTRRKPKGEWKPDSLVPCTTEEYEKLSQGEKDAIHHLQRPIGRALQGPLTAKRKRLVG